MADLDKALGTKSGDNVKAGENILAKASRPAILAKKPWHDVEHIRDSYRFKTVLGSVQDLPEVMKRLSALGAEIVKPDVEKVLRPKEFGWRIAAFDLRMPNGQLVEYYLPVRELEQAKKAEGHKLFEEVRNLDVSKPEDRARFDEVAARSRDLYDRAWAAYLERTGETESAVRAALDKAAAEVSSSLSKPSRNAAGLRSRDGLDQRPEASRIAEKSPGPKTAAALPPSSETNARTSDIANTPSTDAKSIAHRPAGKMAVAFTQRGDEVQLRYRLVDISDLVTSHDDTLRLNPAFPQELQPRDRTRMSSEAQITDISNDIKPEFLAESPKASDGAPIVGSDAVVESGNARTIALRRAYVNGKADHYREWLRANAGRFGLSAADIDTVKQPMLVREGLGKYDRAEFARQANVSPVLSMAETEVAQADAKKLPDLEGLVTNDDGSINPTQSAEFIRQFMRYVASPNEHNQLMTGDGRLSQRGAARIRNAIFSKAYGDSDIVSLLTEATDGNVRNLLAGMLRAAPDVARVRTLLEAGARAGRDFVPDLVDAVRRFGAAREASQKVEQYLAQGSMFGGEAPPAVADLMRSLEKDSRAPTRIADMIRGLVAEIDKGGDPRQPSMF